MIKILFILVCILITYIVYKLIELYAKYLFMGFGVLASIFLLGIVMIFFNKDIAIKMIAWPIAISIAFFVVTLISGFVAAVVVAPINFIWLTIKDIFKFFHLILIFIIKTK